MLGDNYLRVSFYIHELLAYGRNVSQYSRCAEDRQCIHAKILGSYTYIDHHKHLTHPVNMGTPGSHIHVYLGSPL